MKKLLLASAMFLTTFSSQAARVQFDFDVLSSGASIYPCNAGLKHKPQRGKICYNPETFQSCNPDGNGVAGQPTSGQNGGGFPFPGGGATGGQFPGNGPFPGQGNGPGLLADIGLQETPPPSNNCDPQTGVGCDCVCTGDMDGDYDNTLDVMKATYTAWRDHGDPTFGIDRDLEVIAGTHSYNELEDEYFTGNKFAARLKELSFNLGSEKYGSKYFVDICFRATQIDYLTENQDESFNINVDEIVKYADNNQQESLTPFYKAERKVTATDLAGSPTIDLNWDLNNGPIVWSAHSYQSLANLHVKTVLYCKDKNGGSIFVDGPSASLANNSTVNFPDLQGPADLRGCVVRYVFKEKSGHSPNKIDRVRRWKMHGANICTDTAITSLNGGL